MSMCKICHKPLGEALLNQRSCYDYCIVGGVVCIVDHDHGRSVTNDAENVIADLIAAGLDLNTQPVIYRDTMGVWDRLSVEDGRFVGFAPLSARDQNEAIEKLRSANSLHLSAAERAWQEGQGIYVDALIHFFSISIPKGQRARMEKRRAAPTKERRS